MNANTHIVGGVTSGLILLVASANGDFGVEHMDFVPACGSMALSILGSLAPDIDLRNSKVGSAAAPVSSLVNTFFGHRTICHSPLLWGIVYMVLCHHVPMSQPYALAFVVGAISHLLLDMLNKAGVPLFWPVPTRFWIGGVKLDGLGEKAIRYTLYCLSALMVVNLSPMLLGSM